MLAAWWREMGAPLELRELPDSAPRASGVVVRVLAARVPSYTARVLDGSLGYDLTPPLVPGPTCVGLVEAVGEDVFAPAPGQVVLCNSLLEDGGESILIGWTGSGTPRSRAMQAVWPQGSFAQMAHYPARCLTPLPQAEGFPRELLPFLASLAIAQGGLRRAGLRPGDTVAINGATGQLGGAGVLLALAQGAASVIALGRHPGRLAALAALDRRVHVHALVGDRARDAAAIRALAPQGLPVAVDYLGPTPGPEPTLACLDALAVGGTLTLVGGVRQTLAIPYAEIMRRQLTLRGSFMFSHADALAAWRLARAGALSLAAVTPHAYPLTEIERAIGHAATLGGLEYALVLPNG